MANKQLTSRQSEWQIKQENLLIAIDQLEQLTEVMTEVLTRVKHQVKDLEEAPGITPHKKAKADTGNKPKKRGLVH